MQLICYESEGGESWQDRLSPSELKLPVNHNFSFHKVAMDSYALNWRQRQRNEQRHNMLPTGDSDLDSDEDGLIEFAKKQESEGGGTTITGVGTS